MPERIILDPTELATGRTELDITPWVKVDGVDWGDGDIEAYRSQGEFGEQVIDYRLPNRQVTLPLIIQTRGGTTFATARSAIQAKAAIYQREGGWLKRITSSGGTLYADVQLSGLKLSGSWLQATKDADPDASLSLEVSPDFYGNEIQLSDHTETSAAELVFTETAISGDYPARVRVVVDEDDADAQLGLIWGFRRRNYSSAATARLQYEAEALQPLDIALRAALTGASGGTVVTHGTLSTNWTPVLGMNMAGTAYLTHVGTYRWWCRYRTTSGTAVQLRGVYDVGDLVNPEENPRWTHPAETSGTAFYVADLGQIRLDPAPVGTHRWTGQIQGKGDVGTENVSLDRVWFQPLDESAGLLRAVPSGIEGLTTYSARDEFNQSAGALTTKVAPVGGTWTGAGDADDFAVEATGHTAQRTAVSDTDANTGRYGILGTTNFTNVLVAADVGRLSLTGAAGGEIGRQGVLARYTDTSNWLMAVIEFTIGTPIVVSLKLIKRVAGAAVDLGSVSFNAMSAYPSGDQIWLLADDSGRVYVWAFPYGSPPGRPLITVQHADLATGGALATGKPGIYDARTGTFASTRFVGGFYVSVPQVDAVLYASQSAELRWDGMFREDTGGTAYGPVSWVEGDLPRLPPTVGGTTEVFVKASRGNFEALPDLGIDDASARITYRPCWLHPNS